MTFQEMVKSSFIKIDNLKQARNAAFSKIILFLLLLSVMYAIPITFQAYQVFQSLFTDSQEIAEKIPDFTIENNTLTPAEPTEGFIYQTDSIIFTFDPEGKRTATDVSGDMVGNLVSIGLLQKELVVSLPDSGVTSALFDSNQLKISYQNSALENLNGENLRQTLITNQIPWWVFAVTFFIALYPSFLNLIMTLLIAALIGNIYAKFKRYDFSLYETLKIIILSAALPTLLSAILQFILPDYFSTTLILVGSVFIYSQAIKGSPQKSFPE